jgi:hypothetical protein
MQVSDAKWASIYACIWSDQTKALQDAFEKDPKTTVVAKFQVGANDTLLDLTSYDQDPIAGQLRDPHRTESELTEVIKSLTLYGQAVQIRNPVFTPPTGTGKPIPLPQDADPNAISVANWTRIYAYIWLQEKKNPGYRKLFEADPLKGVQQIVPDMKNTFKVTITYQKLLNLGDPPNLPTSDTLDGICKDMDAKKYRHKPHLCC